MDTVWYLSGKSLNSPQKHRRGAGSLLGVSSCYVHTALKLSCVGVLQLSVWGEVGGIQVLGQPWFIPSESSVLLSGLLGQLSKYHESSGKREFACTHVCTHTYAHARNPPAIALSHRSQLLFHLMCWADEFLCGPSLTTTSLCKGVCLTHWSGQPYQWPTKWFLLYSHSNLSCIALPKDTLSERGKEHQQQICCWQLASNGFMLYMEVY